MGSGVVLSEESKLTADIRVYCDPALKEVAGAEADKAGIPLSEFVAQALASFIGRPDLASVPRKPSGRPKTKNKLDMPKRPIGRPRIRKPA